jgi:uncharacterized protein (TIGR02145 family)
MDMKNRTWFYLLITIGIFLMFLNISFNSIAQVSSATVKDIDGNAYKTVLIGTQVWMAENLKTTKYNDGTAIPLVTEDKVWEALTTPAYCWYNNDGKAYKNKYGALYNWYVVNTNRLCPKGWHVPTDMQWRMLTTYLGGDNVAGSVLKETGSSHWLNLSTGATDKTRFTALPGGYRFNRFKDGAFADIGYLGLWWSSTEYRNRWAWYRDMGDNTSEVGRRNGDETFGLSVRCLKD